MIPLILGREAQVAMNQAMALLRGLGISPHSFGGNG